MTDQQLIDRIDFIHAPGLGRGGFSIDTSSSTRQLYDDDRILWEFSGDYVNPIGPFKKYVVLYAMAYSPDMEYHLWYKEEFWRACSEQEYLEHYVRPFLSLLRELVNDRIDSRSISRSYEGYQAVVSIIKKARYKDSIPKWLVDLKRDEKNS